MEWRWEVRIQGLGHVEEKLVYFYQRNVHFPMLKIPALTVMRSSLAQFCVAGKENK
jgi:hypothetical protein